jgi:translocation and assembly module TamB
MALEDLQGLLSGRILFEGGAIESFDGMVARVRLSELSLATSTVGLRNEGPIEVAVDDGAFDVEQAAFLGPSSRLEISGGGSFEQGLALQADGAIDLALLATLTSRVRQAEGHVDLQVNLTGPFSDPAIFGEAHVRDTSFLFASLPEPVENLQGDVTFSAQRILLEDFSADVAGGSVRVRGAATLSGTSIKRYQLDVQADDLAYQPEEGLELALGSDLQLAWTEGQRLPRLEGTVRLDRLLYARPIDVSPTLGELYQARRAEVERYEPSADLIELDLRVIDNGPLRVDTNLAQADIEVEDSERPFRIVGTDQRFGVLGTLTIPRGMVNFRNTEFDIRHGRIDFDNEYRIDPSFDIRATTNIRRTGQLTGPNWRITLHAHGNRDAFQLDASSDPDLSQEDLMMLLTVGMTRTEADQLQAGEIGGTAALEALATVTGVDREVRRRVPVIDDFSLTSRYSNRTNRTEPWMSVSKRISERVRLSAATALYSESRELRTALEFQVDDQTSLQAAYDNTNTRGAATFGNIGVDVRWRLEFE